jgi:hypothetical protein
MVVVLPVVDTQAMGHWGHGAGFSVDGSVRIEAADRAGRERLLRYCARPPFGLDRLRERANSIPNTCSTTMVVSGCECVVSEWCDGWIGSRAEIRSCRSTTGPTADDSGR